jgi:hypothetical protein
VAGGLDGKITDDHEPKLAMSDRWWMSKKLGGGIDEEKLEKSADILDHKICVPKVPWNFCRSRANDRRA